MTWRDGADKWQPQHQSPRSIAYRTRRVASNIKLLIALLLITCVSLLTVIIVRQVVIYARKQSNYHNYVVQTNPLSDINNINDDLGNGDNHLLLLKQQFNDLSDLTSLESPSSTLSSSTPTQQQQVLNNAQYNSASKASQSLWPKINSNSNTNDNNPTESRSNDAGAAHWLWDGSNLPQKQRARRSPYISYYVAANQENYEALQGTELQGPDGQTHREPFISGYRCDEPKDIIGDDELVIRANYPTKIIIFGRYLNENVSLALTPTSGLPQDDCTHNDRVKSFPIRVKTSSVAEVIIDMPSPGATAALYFLCLRDNGTTDRWRHQGSYPWLRLHIEAKFLPLYMQILLIAALLLLSGIFSGLNLGLMSLDKNELKVIIRCGSETEKRYARAIEPVRRRGNYLLCAILFSNVLVNSTIAVLLEDLTSGIVAVMTSTIFIVMFGEILPQAFCSRHGLAVGAKTIFLTYFFMVITFPLAWPVAFMLDLLLGEEIGHVYDRERLMEFIKVTRDYNDLQADEVNIISGALKLKQIPVGDVMTRIEDVYMLNINSVLDFETIQQIIERGYSRIPVYEGDRKNIFAILFAKDLALLDPDDRTPVRTMVAFYTHTIMYMFEDTTLDVALNEFKDGKSHMAIVRRIIDDGERDPYHEVIGVVTLEDVIEEVLQVEIVDETDTLTDNRRKRRRKEAQVRKDFSEFANLGGGDSSFNVASPQLILAAYQYLYTTVDPFTSNYMSDNVLKRLLSQKIYYKCRIERSDSARSAMPESGGGGGGGIPVGSGGAASSGAGTTDSSTQQKRHYLYKAGEPADYFIMILEGRVHVTCGKDNLAFDGGPFMYFGHPALKLHDTPVSGASTGEPSATRRGTSAVDSQVAGDKTSQQSGADTNATPSDGSLLNKRLSISMKKLQMAGPSSQDTTSSAATVTGNEENIGMTRLAPKETRASTLSIDRQAAPTAYYIPDYTVEVVENTSYLKITRNDYLTAYKTTLLEREAGAKAINTATSNTAINTSGAAPDSNIYSSSSSIVRADSNV